MWQRVGGADINRVPSTDATSGTGSFAYVQSSQQVCMFNKYPRGRKYWREEIFKIFHSLKSKSS